MRKICMFFILFLALTVETWGQKVTFYKSGNFLLSIDLYAYKYSVCMAISDDLMAISDDLVISEPDISEGMVLLNNDTITCIDTETKEKVVFKQIDKYRLTVINISSLYANKIVYPLRKNDYLGNCFKLKEIIYAYDIFDSNGKHVSIKWKNGKIVDEH